jgi:hypothetical protein
MVDAQSFQLPLSGIVGQAKQIENNAGTTTFQFLEVGGHGKECDDFVTNEYPVLEYRGSKIGKAVIHVRIVHLEGNAEDRAHEASLVFNEQPL